MKLSNQPKERRFRRHQHEDVDFFTADDDILTIFEAFVTETGKPTNVRKGKKPSSAGGSSVTQPSKYEGVLEPGHPRQVTYIHLTLPLPTTDIYLDETIARLLALEDQDIIHLYNGLSIKHRDQKAQEKGKKTLVQTRTESFQTAIDGEDITPHRRGEMRKAPKTPVTAGRMRCHLLFMDRSPLPLPQQQPRHSLIKIYHTAAAEMTEKVDDTSRASNADIQQIGDI
ncbi:hypothetical protein FPCIR_6814 [Fusarium pseudocircinatum]|uniref:Uncharacterized protein n=1 Tax=Fusarium pseudocircinatum TaxID=56676 RepID=A0A8H5LE13_9HYPO|nr:hypothetical protein FPCIR_6814 [Fusarium pseudocircinatum]